MVDATDSKSVALAGVLVRVRPGVPFWWCSIKILFYFLFFPSLKFYRFYRFYSMIADRMKLIKPSPTLAITAKAKALREKGIDVISLSAGEPDFDTPNHVKEAAIKAINEGKTKYTPAGGLVVLKKAIQKKLKKENNLDYDLDQIVVTNGAKQAIFNSLFVTLNTDDEVIIPAPYWVSYPDMVAMAGGKSKFIKCGIEENFKLSPEKLESTITQKTKWVIINSPSNPTGAMYNKNELLEIANVLQKYPHVHVLSDDIYEHIVFDDQHFYNIAQLKPEIKDRVLVVNGVSKSHAMTGWRIGYCAGPKEIAKAVNTIQSQTTSNASSISQYAVIAALEEKHEILKENSLLFQKRRDLVIEKLLRTEGLKIQKPTGTFYLFINLSGLIGKTNVKMSKKIESSQDFSEYLLEQYSVAVVPGEAFGMPEYMRLSYATDERNLLEACKRIRDACAALT